VDVELADTMPEGWRAWLDWQRAVSPGNRVEIDALEADGGRHLGYVRAIARRRGDARLDEPITSLAVDYVRQPLLRSRRGTFDG
jgi:hypothetical protein